MDYRPPKERLFQCATLAVLGFTLVCMTPVEARADSITIGFTGSVISVEGGLGGTFNTSQTLSGTYTYDPLTPDSDPLATRGQYAITTATFSIGGYTATTSTGFIIVRNDPGSDSLTLDLFPGTWPSVGAFSPVNFGWGLGENTGAPFSSDALPLTPCVPCIGFVSNSYVFEFGGTERVRGTITGFTAISAIPEPSSLLLLGTGLAGLIGVGVVRRRPLTTRGQMAQMRVDG